VRATKQALNKAFNKAFHQSFCQQIDVKKRRLIKRGFKVRKELIEKQAPFKKRNKKNN